MAGLRTVRGRAPASTVAGPGARIERVNELPPDPPRLRAILAYLDRQIAEHETIGTYLQLQRRDVQRALAATKRQAPPRPSASASQSRPQRPPQAERMKLRPGTYMLESKIRPDHPRPPLVHIGGCNRAEGETNECTLRQAELALTQDAVGAAACEHCRPDLSLGLSK